MIRKHIYYRKLQSNHIVWTLSAILLFLSSHNCYSQVYLDTNKVFKTEEDWSKAIDGLFLTGIMDTTKDAWALLRVKVDESGRVVSAHIVKSANIDPSLFYSICATIEDCYDTPFLKDEIEKYHNHLVNGFLYANIMRQFPKYSGP